MCFTVNVVIAVYGLKTCDKICLYLMKNSVRKYLYNKCYNTHACIHVATPTPRDHLMTIVF